MKKIALLVFCCAVAAWSQSRIEVSFPATVASGPLDGRVLLIVAKSMPAASGRGGRGRGGEPRDEINDSVNSQQIFGIDVDGLTPGAPALFDAGVYGYPVTSLKAIPPGDYTVQAVLNIYTTFHRADGHTVKLPMDEGEGQQWNRKPGNLYSTPQKVHFDPATGGVLRIALDQKIAPIPPPADTEWIKHVKIQSALLTKFWGQPMYLYATVVLPAGFASHPEAHYPTMVQQNHFRADIRNPPAGWTDGKLPKFLLVDINHANPYYDDSYAVNSANLGPYGDAITQELIPAVEKQFRGIGQGWSRVNYGCSTGGWETAADQIFYPDYFNGAWSSSPDPVDFHAFQIVDIYNDKNAYWLEGPWSSISRPDERRPDGTVTQYMDRANHRELVLGTHGRSADQWDIWQAVFGPVGPDGYPADIWDPLTGVIDHTVAQYWRDHFDLDAYLEKNWATLAPKLDGKLHFAVGDEDSYYLDNAVYMMQDMIAKHSDPKISADFDFGRKQPHCYDGTYHKMSEEQLYMPQMEQWIVKTAPSGADMSWRYQ